MGAEMDACLTRTMLAKGLTGDEGKRDGCLVLTILATDCRACEYSGDGETIKKKCSQGQNLTRLLYQSHGLVVQVVAVQVGADQVVESKDSQEGAKVRRQHAHRVPVVAAQRTERLPAIAGARREKAGSQITS